MRPPGLCLGPRKTQTNLRPAGRSHGHLRDWAVRLPQTERPRKWGRAPAAPSSGSAGTRFPEPATGRSPPGPTRTATASLRPPRGAPRRCCQNGRRTRTPTSPILRGRISGREGRARGTAGRAKRSGEEPRPPRRVGRGGPPRRRP